MTKKRRNIISIDRIAVRLLGVLAVFALASAIHAAGEVDPTFTGSSYGDLNFGNGNIHVVKALPDGKILIGGQFTEVNGVSVSSIARLNADGTLDATFVPPEFFGGLGLGSPIYAIAVQPDGKILVGGDIYGTGVVSRPGVRRLNADGSIDSSFFIEQMQFLGGDIVYDIELQSDGKILIGGFIIFSSSAQRHLARLNADGTRDTTFSATPPNSLSRIKDLEIQPDGKIVAGGVVGVVGPLPTLLYRVNSDGSMDQSFAAIESGSGAIEAVKLQADGKILVAGNYTSLNSTPQGRISRLNANGTVDSSFNLSGSGANAVVNDIAIRPDGKIIISGGFSSFNGTPIQRIARLNSDGSLDNTFTNTGTIIGVSVNDAELLPDNRILAGLDASTLVDSVVRFSADGAFDPSFSVKAGRGGTVNKILQQPDGKIIVAGEFRFANGVERRSLARFNADGTLDTSFVPYFNDQLPLPIISGIALQPDGKIIVGAWHGIVLQRLNSDGSQDTSFNPGLPSSSVVYDVALQADGKVLAVGGMTLSLPRLARFNSNGTLDNTFNPAQPDFWVYKVFIQPDGKVLVGGAFQLISGIANRNGVARYNPNGVLDPTFNPPGGGSKPVTDLDLQLDGKVVVAGDRLIRRLNADGTLDPSLNQSTNAAVNAVKIQPDGKILVGGNFSVVGLTDRNGIARFKANGSLETSFNTFANRGLYDIQLQPDGKILIGGQFTRVNDVPRGRIARLLNAPVLDSTLFDYDGDGRADVSVFRPSENRWYVFRSSDSAVTQTVFAIPGDVPVPADYDGDQKTDIAIYRPSSGAWWYQSSINGAQIFTQWGGEAGDVPRPGDFDGDAKADFIIFRPTNNFWYRISSGDGAVSNVLFGAAGDKPVRGDFDGDGSVDPAIFRPSTGDWWYRSSVNHAQLAVRWGLSTDIPAPADFDGDGKTDFAVYRPSTGVWYIINSSNGSFLIGPFGIPEDKPVPADYDGDGKADIAVFRPSTGIWYMQRSTSGFAAMQFGISTDVPTPNSFVP